MYIAILLHNYHVVQLTSSGPATFPLLAEKLSSEASKLEVKTSLYCKKIS